MESLWIKQKKENGFKIKGSDEHPVSGRYDVIVIGAGMAGILIAYYLQEAGKNVLVLEADTIASGQTEKTTAKITSQHGLKYRKLIRTVGRKKATLYSKANEEALKEYERLIKREKIDCQFRKAPAYLYTQKDKCVIQKEAEAAESIGIDCYYCKDTELPFSVKAALCFRNQAQFSPLEFIRHIASKLNILEHTKVISVKKNKVIAEKAEFTADYIIMTTHYPIINVPGFYFLRQHQERSYVLALSGCKNLEGMYYGIDKDGLSFRQTGDYLLLGGGSHRTGHHKKDGGCHYLMKKAKQHFPNSKVEACWSAQDCMAHDGIPFIGKYSVFTPNLYVATGFGKWGMTSSMVAALILRDKLCGKKNPYEKVFKPQRLNVIAGIGNFVMDIGVSSAGLFKGWLGKKERRCTHLGCQLEWNPDEKTWDCPCHGSRFSEDGKLMDNPSKMDLTH